MISNHKYYEILFEETYTNSNTIYHVGSLKITNNNEVRISGGIPFFYCSPIYCFEFPVDQLIFMCYFKLLNEQIIVTIKQNGYRFIFINIFFGSIKEEFELPILMKRMLYKWHIIDTFVSIITTSDDMIRTVTKCSIIGAKLLYKTKIYEIYAKCLEFDRTAHKNFKIICETDKKPYIDGKNKELCIISQNNSVNTTLHYCVMNINNNKCIMFFQMKKDNYLEIIRPHLYYSDMYWASNNIRNTSSFSLNTFYCPFKLNGFNLEFQDKQSNVKLSTRSSMEAILQDFKNAKNPIQLENVNEMVKKYVIYYDGEKKVAKLFTHNNEIRLDNELNYLFYNGVTYKLYFLIQEKDEIILINEYKMPMEKNQLILIKKTLENNKNLLECELICNNGKLTVLNKEFSAVIIKMGLKASVRFQKLKQARNEEVL